MSSRGLALVLLLTALAGWLLLPRSRSGSDRPASPREGPLEAEATSVATLAGAGRSTAPSRADRDGPPDEAEEAWETWSLDDEATDVVRWSKRVTVTIRSAADQRPIEGAEVRVLVSWRPEEYRVAATDARGCATLERCHQGAVIWVRAAGFLVQTLEPEYADGPFVLDLVPGRPLAGRVLTRTDARPVSAAEVYVWDEVSGKEVDFRPERYHHRGGLATDDAGRYAVAAIPVDRPVTIAARAPGLGIVSRHLPAGEDPGEIVLLLGGGGALTGVVTMDDGTRAAGASVYAVSVADRFAWGHPDAVFFASGKVKLAPVATTDAGGNYSLEGFELPTRVVPVATGPEWSMGAGEAVTLDAGSSEAQRDIVLVTPAWPTVRGQAPDGGVVQPLDCSLLHPDGSKLEDPFFSGGAAYQVGSGEYDMLTRPPGEWILVAKAGSDWAVVRVPITLRPGERSVIDVTFRRGLTLAGIVTSTDGRPVAGAQVVAPDGPARWAAESDADGTFLLCGLSASGLDVEVEHEFYESARLRVACPADEPLRVALVPRPVVRGRVVPRPDRDWHVTAVIRTEEVERGCRLNFDADGSFRVPYVPPDGPFDLVLIHYEFKGPRAWLGLLPGSLAPFELGDVRFDQGQVLEGRVVDAAGRPLADALVETDLGTPEAKATTDGSGRFRLEGLPDGPIRLVVKPAGHAELRTLLQPASTPTLVCPVGTEVRGELVHPEADRVAGRMLWFMGRAAGAQGAAVRAEITTDDLGRFRVQLAPGRYEVWTVRPGIGYRDGYGAWQRARREALLGELAVEGAGPVTCRFDL